MGSLKMSAGVASYLNFISLCLLLWLLCVGGVLACFF